MMRTTCRPLSLRGRAREGGGCLLFLLLLLLPLLLPGLARAASLYVDGFRIYSSGTVNITDNVSDGRVKTVAVQPWDGKVIVGGIFTATGGSPKKTMHNLVRLNTDGTLDAVFAVEPDGVVNTVVVQMDKSDPPQPVGILIGGSFGNIAVGGGPPQPRNGLARLNIDGTLDGTFVPATRSGTVVNAIVVHPTAHRIVVGGSFSELSGQGCSNIAQLADSDGAFQDGFSGGVTGNEVDSIVIQPDGKLVVGGDFQEPHAYLARFQANGALDTSFTVSPDDVVRSLALQADWSIVVGGEFTSITTSNFSGGAGRPHLARVTNDGLLDTFNPAPDGKVSAVAVQPDGRIVIGGAFSQLLDNDSIRTPFAGSGAARLKIDGAVDKSLVVRAGGVVESVLLQPDEKVLIGGRFTTAGGKPRSMLARFYGYGVLDDDVAIGTAMSSDGGPGQGWAVHQQADGGIILMGVFDQLFAQPAANIVRLNPDWSYPADTPFNIEMRTAPNASANSGVTVYSPLLDDQYTFVGGEGGLFAGAYVHDGYFYPYDGTLDLSIPFNSQRIAELGVLVEATEGARCGVEAPDGKIFTGGVFWPGKTPSDPFNYDNINRIIRWQRNGLWDHTFQEPPLDVLVPELSPLMDPWQAANWYNLDNSYWKDPSTAPRISAMLIQPGTTADNYQVIIGTNFGNIFRVNSDGTLDASFVLKSQKEYMTESSPWDPDTPPTYLPFMHEVTSLSFDKDGRIIAGGSFNFPFTDQNGRTWNRNLIRINQDGTIDDSFRVAAMNTLPDYVDYAGAYSINFTGSNLTITAKPVTVTADVKSKLYGGGDPSLTYTCTPALLGADTLSGALTRASGETVAGGPYAIQQGTLANSNYNITYVGANLTVQPKPVTVTADAKTKIYGGSDPAFTYSVSPALVGSDVLSGGLTRVSGESVAGGPYAILQGTLANSNYSITYLGATLTVQPKAITVTADAKSKVYGSADPSFTYSVAPALTGTDALSGALTRVSGENVAASPYAIELGTLGNANYSISFVGAGLSIQPKAVSVTADAKSKAYGDADPGLTYSANPGLVAGDSFSGALSRAGGEGVAGSPYPIQQGTLALNANYNLIFVGANFSITARAVQPRALLHQQKGYHRDGQ